MERIPATRREAELISTLTQGKAVSVMGFDASRDRVLGDPTLVNASAIHFAVHGVLDGSHPALSGLVFSLIDREGAPVDGFLRLHDIYGLKLGAGLVVLSACRTALGREVRGEGMVGLARGFFHAGASRLVATLWDIEDQSTADLMGRFYRGMLTDHLPPSAALRAAQEELWKAGRQPYAWAGIVFLGEWRR